MTDAPNDQQASTTYDAELRRHNDVLHRAADVQRDDHVLDIGCGSGQTTRQAARMAQDGSALGVDVSAIAIQRAAGLAAAEGLRNVTFTHADAQVHPFPKQHFDLAISRFGTMFFADPTAAFRNIGGALRPTGRLAMLVWQARELNEWAVVIRRCLEAEGWAAPASTGPTAFSLANERDLTDILHAAEFTAVTIADVTEPVFYGASVDSALAWIRGFACTNETLQQLGPAAAARAEQRLREAVTKRLTADGVWFDSRAWLVSAQRR